MDVEIRKPLHKKTIIIVIPAKAGIYPSENYKHYKIIKYFRLNNANKAPLLMDSRLRGNDKTEKPIISAQKVFTKTFKGLYIKHFSAFSIPWG